MTIEVTNDYVSRANTYDASTQNSGALNYLCLEAINWVKNTQENTDT